MGKKETRRHPSSIPYLYDRVYHYGSRNGKKKTNEKNVDGITEVASKVTLVLLSAACSSGTDRRRPGSLIPFRPARGGPKNVFLCSVAGGVGTCPFPLQT